MQNEKGTTPPGGRASPKGDNLFRLYDNGGAVSTKTSPPFSAIADSVPAELQKLKQWVCWKLETNRNSGSLKKVPYTIYEHIRANITDYRTWSDFDAVKHSEKIGFVLTADDGYILLDLDNVLVDGALVKHQELVTELLKAGAFIEVSVSGLGLHALVKGTIPRSGKVDLDIEVYAQRRFVALTLNAIQVPVKIGNGQAILNKLYATTTKPEITSIAELFGVPTANIPVEFSIKSKLPAVVYEAFSALTGVPHGEAIRFKGKLYPSRSNLEGFILSHCIVAGLSFEETYGLFNYFRTGTFAEEDKPAAYLKRYYENVKSRLDTDNLRQLLSRLDVDNLDWTAVSRRLLLNAKAVLGVIIQFGIQYRTLEPAVSYRDIQYALNIKNRKTVSRALTVLEQVGFIHRIPSTVITKSNRYYLTCANVEEVATLCADFKNNSPEMGLSLNRYLLTAVQQNIARQLAAKPASIATLVKLTGHHRKTVTTNLTKLIAKRVVIQQGGLYRLNNSDEYNLQSAKLEEEQMRTKIATQRIENQRKLTMLQQQQSRSK